MRWIFALLLLVTCAWAEPTRNPDLVGPSQRTLERLMMDGTPAAGKANVITRAGGAYGEVYVLVPSAPERVAAALESAVQRPWPGATVAYTEEGLVRVRWSGARFGKSGGENTVPLGAIKTTLVDLGLQPTFGFRARSDATLRPDPTDCDVFRSNRFCRLGTAPQDVRVTVKLPPFGTPFLVLFGLWPVGAISVCLLLARRVGNDPNRTLEERKAGYQRLAKRAIPVGIGPHVPLAAFVLGTGMLYPFSDLWLGSTSSVTIGMAIIMAPLLLLPLVMTLVNPVEKELFKPSPEIQALSQVRDPEADRIVFLRQDIERRAKVATLLVCCLAGLGLSQVLSGRMFFTPIVFAVLGAPFLSPWVADRWIRARRPELIDPPAYRPDLRAEVHEICRALGRPSIGVEPECEAMIVRSPSIRVFGGRLRVTEPFVQGFDPAARRFFIAYGLSRVRRNLFLAILPAWALCMVGLLGRSLEPWLSGSFLVAGLVVFAVTLRSMRRLVGFQLPAAEKALSTGVTEEEARGAILRALEIGYFLQIPPEAARRFNVSLPAPSSAPAEPAP